MRLSKDIFICKSEIIHNYKYDYSLVNYVNNRTKVKILCKEHGVFEQIPGAHLRGQSCKKCLSKNISNFNGVFIDKSKNIHNNLYDYSLVEYINSKTKVKIICKKHGIFHQRPDSHVSGFGCSKCAIYEKGNLFRKNLDLEKISNIHNNRYDYSLVNYINNRTKIKIICQTHGVFEQSPYSHYKGMGCYLCGESCGEIKIKNYLDLNNIEYIKQKRFDGCFDKRKLPFDFYLPNIRVCIEFDGLQHFKPIEYWGGCKTLEIIKKHDRIKDIFCIENNIDIFRIKYNENIIEKLSEKLKLKLCQN